MRATIVHVKRQQAIVCELHAMAQRLDQMLLTTIFREGNDFAEGQANSCLITAGQQLNTVITMIFDMGESGVLHPKSMPTEAAHDPLLPKLERRGKPRGKRGMETASGAKNGVVCAGKRAVASVVSGGSR